MERLLVSGLMSHEMPQEGSEPRQSDADLTMGLVHQRSTINNGDEIDMKTAIKGKARDREVIPTRNPNPTPTPNPTLTPTLTPT